MRLVCLTAVLLSTWTATLPARAEDQAGLDYFEKNVRPLLARHCYKCHSDKKAKKKGGLLLDRKAGWVSGGDSGPAIVPGKPNDSLLIQSVRYESFEMPPDGKLAESEIRILEKWVRMGAPDPRSDPGVSTQRQIDLDEARQFWVFQPPHSHTAPEVLDEDWSKSPIDRFIQKRLEQKNVKPVADAKIRTLARRIHVDLTGLPPDNETITSLTGPSGEDRHAAIGALVDRLLKSPQFGEHWGRHWLDVARYADSNGGDINLTYFNAWRYRDYVVDSFNDDRPFDEFIVQQIAGDLLPATSDEQRVEQLTATGFLIVGPKMLSERNKEKLHMDVVDEQLDTIGRVFLGMTFGCARCHDHKFDPILASDYYGMAGILRSTETVYGIRMGNVNVSGWLEQPLPMDAELTARVESFEKQDKALSKQLADAKKQLSAAQKTSQPQPDELLGIAVDDAQAELVGAWKKSTYSPNFVGAGYIHDDKKDVGKKSVTFRPEITDAGEYEVRISYPGANGRADNVPVTVSSDDGEQSIVVDQSRPAELGGLFKSLGRFRFEAGSKGFVRISNTATNGYVIVDAAQFVPVALLKDDPKAVRKSGGVSSNQAKVLAERVKRLEAEQKKLKTDSPKRPMAMAVRDFEKVSDTEFRIRGIADHKGDVVPRGVLTVARFDGQSELNLKQSGRVELARWIADARNPLTARVIVNRVWMHLMGEGLVRSVDNFGRLGDRPSHPELLDTLVTDFIADGWSMKRLIRRICLSRVYGLSSEFDQAAFDADPENRLWWRQRPRRLPAESIRDAMLTVSGQLDPTRGGSTVATFGESAVANNTNETSENRREGAYRRSIYLPVVRNELPPILTVFDFADPDVVTGKRAVTNVPAQALLMLNSPFVRNCAKATVNQLQEQSGLENDEARIDWLYNRLLGRNARPPEVERAMDYVQSLSVEGLEFAAWVSFTHSLLASSEFRILN